MKCSIVVNQLNDPFYIDYDEEFARHIIKTCKEKQLIEEDAVITELDANLVMQVFSPLVLSQWLLIDQTKAPCSCVRCPNGFIFVFRHVDGLLFLSINGDLTESEEFLHRKTQIFIRLMKFLFGPVSQEIGESQYSSKKSKWDFLRVLMKTWTEMVATEQAFLVEATERLSVNQLVSEKCIEILERAVKQIQAVQDQPTQHAVLLVNSKLLALYSNRSAHELRPKDILSLMILAKTMYPRSDHLEDLFSKPYVNTKKRHSNIDDNNSDGVEDEYHSAPATPLYDDTRSRNSSVRSDDAGESTVSHPDERGGGSISMSDTDTIINSLAPFSGKHDSAVFHKSSEKEGSGKEKTLIDMYKERCSDLDTPEEDVQTDETESTQEMCVNHIVIADVHKEHGNCTDDKNTADWNGNLTSERIASDLTPDENVKKNKKNYIEVEVVEVKGEHSQQVVDTITDTISLASTNKSRASTMSSDHGEEGTQDTEEASLPSLRSTTSSVVSNVDDTYPELSFQMDPQTAPLTDISSINLRYKDPRSSKRNAENRRSQHSPAMRQKPKRVPTPTNTAEESAFLIDTMQSFPFHRSYGNYIPQTVFLETATCLYSPHNIHTAQVLPGVTILFLSQAPRHPLADPLYQVMSNIQDLSFGRRVKLPRSRSIHVYDIINSLLAKLHNSLRKFKGRERSLISDIHARWEKEDLKLKLLEYLEKDSRFHIPPEVEAPLNEMNKKLRELFSLLFLYPPPENPQLWESLSQLRVAINAELLDYREYLNVKSQRNITMTSYFEKYPGLVYFIFVDRRLHQMTAPSLNISLNEGEEENASTYLKDNIWRMYQVMMQKLTEGYTTVVMREGDFYYSHFLWFEDNAGNPLAIQECFKPSNKYAYPGILCGSFYKDIIQQCFPHMLANSVFCFEMFMMHVGSVHPQYIASHCKKLANELWEMSGDAYSSLNLF